MGAEGKEISGEPAEKMTLSRKIVIGLLAGIACGLFFGEWCSVLRIVGSAFVALMQMTVLPEWKSGGFFSTSLLQPADTVDFVELYIPANPFYSLTQNLVPAVVLFCICLGVAMIGISQKAAVIEPMRIMLEAMSRVTVAVAQLTPYGVFAIAANASGTVTFAELDRLQGYMLIYLAATVILTFVTMPLAVTVFTPFTYRQILSASRGPLLPA